MTTMDSAKVECGVCGAKEKVTILTSTNQFGHPDLDCRPPPMARGTMAYWVQECSACGFCAADISNATPEEQAICQGESYGKFRSSVATVPHLARTFMTAAYIASNSGDEIEACHLNLCAAWVYDDRGDDQGARAQRMIAAGHLESAHKASSRRFEGPGEDEALLADMLRRAGDFECASAVCREALSQTGIENVREVLEYQILLCEGNDSARHTMEELAKPDDEFDPQEGLLKKVWRKLNSPL